MSLQNPPNSSPGSGDSSSNPEETPEQRKTRRKQFLDRIRDQGLHFDLSNEEIEAGYEDDVE